MGGDSIGNINPHKVTWLFYELGLKLDSVIWVIRVNWVTVCLAQRDLTWFIKYPNSYYLSVITHQGNINTA